MTGEPVVLVLLVAALGLGSWGWGRAAVLLLTRLGWADAASVVTVPIQLVVGMALFLSVGGFLVAAGVAYFGVLLAWHLVGTAFLAPALPAAAHRVRLAGRGAQLAGVGTAVVGLFAFVVAFGESLGIQLYNPVDDDGAYIYLAKRLLLTGGMQDPFSLRRITSYGGNELYQAMFLQATGNASLRAAEFIFGAGVLLVLVVAHTRRRWPALGVLLLGIPLVLGHGEGPVANLSPSFSVAALSLAAFVLLRHVGRFGRRQQVMLFSVVGLLVAGIVSLRAYFAVSVAVAVAIVAIAVGGRRSVVDLSATVVTAAAASIGWAVALQRSSGTPLFPVVAGTYNRSWPSGADPTLHGFAPYWHRFLLAFNGYDIGWVALVAVFVGAAYWLLGARPRTQMLVLCAAGVGSLAEMAAMSVLFSGSVPNDVVRYVAASTLASGLLAIDALWPLPRTEQTAAAVGAVGSETRRGVRHYLSGSVVSSAVAVVVAGMLFGTSLPNYVSLTRDRLHRAQHVVDATAPLLDRYRAFEPEYHALNRLVPAGSALLAAVDLPSLLDMTRFRVATLDFAGAVSPPPHMPFLDGPGPTVAYLRQLGYRYIATETTGQLGIYYYPLYVRDLRFPVYFDREEAPWYFAWEKVVRELETSGQYRVARSGDLALIDLGALR